MAIPEITVRVKTKRRCGNCRNFESFDPEDQYGDPWGKCELISRGVTDDNREAYPRNGGNFIVGKTFGCSLWTAIGEAS